MTTSVLSKVANYVQRHDMLPSGTQVVVGVSGGPDSLCLLHVLWRLRDELGIGLHVATLDHGLRPESADEVRFVADFAQKLGLPVTIGRRDVTALATEHKLGLEEAARQARYAFLAEVAFETGATHIAVGHNADDQVETVLMHFLRGAGLAGLRGMLPVTPLGEYHLPEPLRRPLTLVRPLLNIPRREIEAYCREHGLKPRFDRSNLDTTFFRNRLRHEVIPLLEGISPRLRERVLNMADVLAADYEVLREQLNSAWERVIRDESAGQVIIGRGEWLKLPLSLQRAVIRRAVWQLRGNLRDVSFLHVDSAVWVGRDGKTGSQATLPAGLILRVEYDSLIVAPAGEMPAPPDWPLLWGAEPLTVPDEGVLPLPGSDWVLVTERTGAPLTADVLADPWTAALNIPRGADMILRGRRPGDRFTPQGMGGHHQKVSDFMINAKIPAWLRDHIPLLVVNGEIAWVAGFRVGEHFTITGRAEDYLLARFTGSAR